MDVKRLKELISPGEGVERESKSDRRRISHSEVYEEVVALADTLGGVQSAFHTLGELTRHPGSRHVDSSRGDCTRGRIPNQCLGLAFDPADLPV